MLITYQYDPHSYNRIVIATNTIVRKLPDRRLLHPLYVEDEILYDFGDIWDKVGVYLDTN